MKIVRSLTYTSLAAAVFFMGSAFGQGAKSAAPAAGAKLDGKALFASKNCFTCHGADGNTPTLPIYPKLKGQSAVYLENQIQDIKAGKRTNGMTALMKPFAMMASDAEIKAIANFLATGK